jgi:hypothetical protein
MPTLETLTQADLVRSFNTQSLKRARERMYDVQNPVRRGQSLYAQIRGMPPYEVEIELTPTHIMANCSCPYDWGGYCEHIGAVLLRWIRDPIAFTVEAAPGAPGDTLETVPMAWVAAARPASMPDWLSDSLAQRRRDDAQQAARWLKVLSVADLRQMARQRGWRLKGTRKDDLVVQVAELLGDPADVARAAAGLDEEHRAVLRAILWTVNHPPHRVEVLPAIATFWGELRGYREIEIYAMRLRERGLAMLGPLVGEYQRGDFVPGVVARHLPPLLERALPFAENPASDWRIVPGEPSALVRTAAQVLLVLEQSAPALRPPMPRPVLEKYVPGLGGWDYDPAELMRERAAGRLTRHTDVALTVPPPAGRLPDDVVARLAPLVGSAAQVDFIFALLLGAGLFYPGSPVTLWPEVRQEWLARGEAVQHAVLARTYIRLASWSELWTVLREQAGRLTLRRLAHPNVTPTQMGVDLVRFRHLVLRVFASIPDGRWVALADLFRLLRVVWPRFDQTVWQAYWHPGVRPSWFLAAGTGEQPLAPEDSRHWELAQGNFVRAMLAGPLYGLGLVDLAYQGEELAAVSFHGLGDLYWDRAEALPERAAGLPRQAIPGEAVRVEEGAILVHPAYVGAQAHALLDRIARLEEARADRFTYRLDAGTTYRSFEAGVSPEDLLAGWEQALGEPAPESLQTQLRDWWAAYGQVRLYERVTVIELADDYALAELRVASSLDHHLVAEISPRLVVVRDDAVDALVAELEKAGYRPKRTTEV